MIKAEVGTLIGPYELLAPLGAGGMGEVYRARDSKLGREVAIKMLPEAFASDPERLRRFEREARALGALSHPNILTIHDVGSHEGAPFLVMELLEGGTLRERLRGRALPAKQAVEIALRVARGLAAAHEKGIVHRDLKPENVFVCRNGHVKVLDFGLAKQAVPGAMGVDSMVSTPEVQAVTREGSLVGTTAYMSPEQVRGENVDGRSDLFSLGVMLYELLAGQRPFQGTSPIETLHAILHTEVPALPSSAGVPPPLVRILSRCLEKETDRRFQTARDLAFALEGLSLPVGLEIPAQSRDEASIVVLPFENLSPDPDNAYFADGLTEETIAGLSKVSALRVISRTSAMHYRGSDKPLPLIAGELRVRYALEGSVRKVGNSLRITAQLIEAATDAHLWAETYGGTLDDVFDIQEKVARAIVEALRIQLTAQEDQRLTARPLPNAAAYDCYLRAHYEVFQWTPDGLARAERSLNNALAIVGEHPMILAGLSQLHFQAVNMGYAQEDGLAKALAFAERALELDPASAQAHAARGMLCTLLEGDFPMGVRHYRLAMAAAPGDVATWDWLPWLLTVLGKDATVVKLTEELIRLDPVNPTGHLFQALGAFFRGEFALAADRMPSIVRMAGDSPLFLFWHALALAFAGRHSESLDALGTLPLDAATDTWIRLEQLLRATLQEQAGAFDRLLSEDFLLAVKRDGQNSWHVGGFQARLGRRDAALDWLENAVDRTFVPVALFERDPFLASVRDDPRFGRILARARRIQASVPD